MHPLIRRTHNRRPAWMMALALALWLPLQGYAAVTGCCHGAMAGDLVKQIEKMPACHDMMLSDPTPQADDQTSSADEQQAAQHVTSQAGCGHCAGCHFASSGMTPPAALFTNLAPAGRIDAVPPAHRLSTPYAKRPQRPPLARVA